MDLFGGGAICFVLVDELCWSMDCGVVVIVLFECGEQAIPPVVALTFQFRR